MLGALTGVLEMGWINVSHEMLALFPAINAMGKVYSQSYLPVRITQVPELGANEAGQEGSNSALGNKGLCDCPNPEVNIVRCPIQLHELLGQFGIA